jgi:hypothetical protein
MTQHKPFTAGGWAESSPKGREYAFTSAILSKDSTLETYNFKIIVIP